MKQPSNWVPSRRDVIWIDCNPQAGTQMCDRHPLLVLSPKAFNAKTSLVIGLPMTTAAYNAGNPFAVALSGAERRGNGEKPSYVLCHQPKSFDWRARSAELHPAGQLAPAAFSEACNILEQIIQVGGS